MLSQFNDPFNYEKSIQLNSKYWNNPSYKYLNILEDAEGYLSLNSYYSMVKTLRKIDHPSLDGLKFTKLIRRIIKLHKESVKFGLVQNLINIEEKTIQELEYKGLKTRSSYAINIEEGSDLYYLSKVSYSKYKEFYGADIIKMNQSVRFASPDNCAKDTLDYGPLSDFHFDERKGITTVIYLSEVDIKAGPFQYIKNSELINKSTILTAIGQYVCFDLGIQHPTEMSDLPFEFRLTPSVGNFLDHWKIEKMESNLVTLNGGPGSYVMFNGQNILHRGGKPLGKNRLAIFLQPEGLLMHKLRALGGYIGGAILFGVAGFL